MRSIVYAVLAPLCLPLCLSAAGDEAAKADLAKLQGYWRLEGFQEAGVKPELQRLLHGIDRMRAGKGAKRLGTLAVQGDKFGFNGADKLKRLAVGKVDAAKSPKAIDLTAASGNAKGTTFVGIYKLEVNQLTLCIGEGDNRPTEFKAAPGRVLLRYTRIKR